MAGGTPIKKLGAGEEINGILRRVTIGDSGYGPSAGLTIQTQDEGEVRIFLKEAAAQPIAHLWRQAGTWPDGNPKYVVNGTPSVSIAKDAANHFVVSHLGGGSAAPAANAGGSQRSGAQAGGAPAVGKADHARAIHATFERCLDSAMRVLAARGLVKIHEAEGAVPQLDVQTATPNGAAADLILKAATTLFIQRCQSGALTSVPKQGAPAADKPAEKPEEPKVSKATLDKINDLMVEIGYQMGDLQAKLNAVPSAPNDWKTSANWTEPQGAVVLKWLQAKCAEVRSQQEEIPF